MNIYLKPTIILSAIVGAILGLLLLLPFFSFSFLVCVLFALVSVFVIFYLKKNSLVGILGWRDCKQPGRTRPTSR